MKKLLPGIYAGYSLFHGLFAWTIRISSYCVRFTKNLKESSKVKSFSVKRQILSTKKLNSTYKKNSLTSEIINSALILCIKSAQKEFAEEMKDLQSNKPVKKSGTICNLHPFLDEDGTLKVGGRLHNSELQRECKHPFILATSSMLTQRIFENEHNRLFHAPPSLLLSSVRSKFWPLQGRILSRKTVEKCIPCCKNQPKMCNQKMALLPKTKVTPSHCFSNTGIDFAGPL